MVGWAGGQELVSECSLKVATQFDEARVKGAIPMVLDTYLWLTSTRSLRQGYVSDEKRGSLSWRLSMTSKLTRI